VLATPLAPAPPTALSFEKNTSLVLTVAPLATKSPPPAPRPPPPPLLAPAPPVAVAPEPD
jgi:hypothetical protein